MPCPNATLGTIRPTNRAFVRLHCASSCIGHGPVHYPVIPNKVRDLHFVFLRISTLTDSRTTQKSTVLGLTVSDLVLWPVEFLFPPCYRDLCHTTTKLSLKSRRRLTLKDQQRRATGNLECESLLSLPQRNASLACAVTLPNLASLA